MTYMKLKHIICTVCLLAAGIGHTLAATWESEGTESHKKAKESSDVRFISGSRNDGEGRVTLRWRAVSYGSNVILQARILRNNFMVQVVKPGLGLLLENGETITLTPERKPGCCGDWATGKWNNVSFLLTASDIEKLKENAVKTVTIPTRDEGTIECSVPSGKQKAFGKILRSVTP